MPTRLLAFRTTSTRPILGIMLALILIIAAASRARAADNVLRFWYSLPASQATSFDALLHQYAQAHPEIQLETRAFPTMDALQQALLDPSQPPPHLALIDSRWQDELIQRGRITPAQDEMDKTSNMIRISMKADTYPAMWDAVQRGDKVWTVPAFESLVALLYDADMLKAAHLKRAPRTWGEMIFYGKKLHHKSKDGEVWGFELPLALPSPALGELFDAWAEQAGELSPVTDAETLTDAAHLKAMQFWTDLVYKYKVAPAAVTDPADAAMFVGGEEDLIEAQTRGRQLEAAPLPSFKSNYVSLDAYCVALGNTDLPQLDQAWQMAYWVCDFPQLLTWTTETPYLPANKQVALSPGYYQFIQSHPGLRSFVNEMLHAHPDPGTAAEDEALGDAVKSAATQHVAPVDALKAAHDKLTGGAPAASPSPTPAPAPAPAPTP